MVPAWLEIVKAAADAILLVALTILVLGAIPALFMMRRTIKKSSDEIGKALEAAGPLLKDASTLVTELRSIAASARSDVAVVHQLVVDADARLREIGHKAESRVAELDSVVGVLRDGLEDAVVSVAAVAHGVRAGTAALGIGEEEETPAAVDDGEADQAGDDDFLEVGAHERGRHNGDDRAGPHGRQTERAQPRIRGQRREE
jgi:hypothetical protein